MANSRAITSAMNKDDGGELKTSESELIPHRIIAAELAEEFKSIRSPSPETCLSPSFSVASSFYPNQAEYYERHPSAIPQSQPISLASSPSTKERGRQKVRASSYYVGMYIFYSLLLSLNRCPRARKGAHLMTRAVPMRMTHCRGQPSGSVELTIWKRIQRVPCGGECKKNFVVVPFLRGECWSLLLCRI